MANLEVGRLYAADRRRWPRAVNYLYRCDGHHLALFINGVTACQEDDLARGRAELAVVFDWREITLCSRFGESIPWCHSAPFRWHGMPPADRILPPDPDLIPGLHGQIQVVLVEADDGTVRALRSLSLTSASTAVLHAAIRGQAGHLARVAPPLWAVARLSRLYRDPRVAGFRTRGRLPLETSEES